MPKKIRYICDVCPATAPDDRTPWPPTGWIHIMIDVGPLSTESLDVCGKECLDIAIESYFDKNADKRETKDA